jgi:hypothetical protein
MRKIKLKKMNWNYEKAEKKEWKKVINIHHIVYYTCSIGVNFRYASPTKGIIE